MSKFQTTIKLVQKNDEGNYDTKQYKSAEFLPGSVMEDATDIQEKLSKASQAEDADGVKEALKEMYEFVADTIFEGQFTGEEFRAGIDAREIAKIAGQILRSVTSGYDETYVNTKKK